MTSYGNSPFLDQARDPYGPVIRPTVDAYDKYQQQGGTYAENYRLYRDKWEQHYSRMRTAFQTWLWDLSETVKPRKDMNLAVVGPGFHLGTRDLNKRIVESGIAKLHRIVLIDFSIAAIRSSMDSLLRSGVPAKKVFGMQFDITGGLSTVYDRLLAEKLSGVDREDQLAQVIDELAQTDIVGELHTRLTDALKISDERDGLLQPGDMGTELPVNSERTLKMSFRKEPIELDAVSLHMVLAGTGAAAEGRFWDKFDTATATTDRSSGGRVDERILGRRRVTVERFYEIVMQYNTKVAAEFLGNLIGSHPRARVLAMTDVTTRYKKSELEPLGSLLRLNINAIRAALRGHDIYLRREPVPQWEWDDEDDHSHAVQAMMLENLRATGKLHSSTEGGEETGDQAAGGDGPGVARSF